jgi:hypothetical protein
MRGTLSGKNLFELGQDVGDLIVERSGDRQRIACSR